MGDLIVTRHFLDKLYETTMNNNFNNLEFMESAPSTKVTLKHSNTAIISPFIGLYSYFNLVF